jgi:ABC-type proline/glycine betaine transport system permease subunit
MSVPDLHIGEAVGNAIGWLQTHWAGFFNAVAAVMDWLINKVLYVLTAPSWVVIVVVAVALALWARGVLLAIFALAGFLLIESMQLWTEAMQTLAIVLVASVLAVAVGVPLGIWAAQSRRAGACIRPLLDFMQTLPVFVYLIPAVFFFGIGVVPGTLATWIFAIPPAVRLTELGLKQVDSEIVEAGIAFGARPWQMLRTIRLPLAVPSIMAGLNQVIMMALSMVVIAGMVGAGGLGTTVVTGLSQLNVGLGFQGGLSVVLLAIYLDRVTGAFPRTGKRRLLRRRSKQPVASPPIDPAASAPRPVPAATESTAVASPVLSS